MKTYTISKTKPKKKTEENFKCVFEIEDVFFIENGHNNIGFLWPRSTAQSEFPIKSYSRLKLRWSDFDFYFVRLSSFSLSVSQLSFISK
jgi:hypothetical protein